MQSSAPNNQIVAVQETGDNADSIMSNLSGERAGAGRSACSPLQNERERD
jgi:hypothetical protein